MSAIEVREYRLPSGEGPFGTWFLELDGAVRARIRARIRRISLGNLGDTRSLGDGLFELRFHFGPGYRVYFGCLGNHVVLLLGGGDKVSQERDIAKSRAYWTNSRRHQ